MRLIDADALLDHVIDIYCKNCERRKGVKNGKYRIIYEVGDVPCRSCGIDDMKSYLENAPTIEPQHWIPCSQRLPSKEERKEWIDKNLGGIGYLYPCLVTRYSSINPNRAENNPYVAKHYYDGEDFLNAGEEVCSEYIIAWMPLPKPWKEG